jgi:hypothetical protein
MYQVYHTDDIFMLGITVAFFLGIFCMTLMMTLAQHFRTLLVEDATKPHLDPSQSGPTDATAHAETVPPSTEPAETGAYADLNSTTTGEQK